MNHQEREKRIIERYQEDEQAMILIFAQWCVNHQLDPVQLYQAAYPDQLLPKALKDILQQTVPKDQADEISDDFVLNALQLFGNDDLAKVVQQAIDQGK